MANVIRWILDRRALALLLVGALAYCVLYPNAAKFNPSIPTKPPSFETDALAERLLLLAALVLAIIPVTRRILFDAIEENRRPSPVSKRFIAAAIIILSAPLLYFLAVARGQILLPCWHDENHFRLQTEILAHFRLVMPAHPLAEFFDSPYVFTRPVYGGFYFPGTALLHVPGVWLHLPYSVMPVIIAGVTLALLYLVVTELIDGVAGLLAVMLMFSLELFRWLAVVEMSHAAGALWGLAAMAAWLAWRKSRAMRWIAVAGIAAGMYAITRPLDCVCVLTPIALAWAWDMRMTPWKLKCVAVLLGASAMAPFIGLQMAFDKEVTGHLLQTPASMYYRDYLNARGIGLEKFDPHFSPPSPSMLVHDTYLYIVGGPAAGFTTVRDAVRQWITIRLPKCLGVGLPTLLLVVLYPVGLLQLRDTRRAALWSTLWFFMIGSALTFQFHDQYVMGVTAALIFSVVLGAHAVARRFTAWPGVEVFICAAIFALAVHRVFAASNDYYQRPITGIHRQNYFTIPGLVKKPAIVLFRYVSDEWLDDPVYNWDVTWPDDAPIIRANDLGARRDRELFEYYARIQPDRTVYVYDQGRRSLELLGNVVDLAKYSGPGGSKRN
jgi:hypothetical protein